MKLQGVRRPGVAGFSEAKSEGGSADLDLVSAIVDREAGIREATRESLTRSGSYTVLCS